MTVSEQIIEEYLKKGKSLKDVPPELKDRLNESGISKLYKALVEYDIIEPVEIDEEKEPEGKEDEAEGPAEDSADKLEDDEPEEKKASSKSPKGKFEDVWGIKKRR